MAHVVELLDICFLRGAKTILANVSWTIETGQQWVLLGANGSGKTTLLKIMTGYSWATSGSVTLLGNRFGQCDIRACRKQVGWVSTALQEHLPANDSAADIVASGIDASMGLYRHFSAAERERALAALELMQAEHLSRQPYVTLSQGEQQRVVIARALINEPRLLILDEPCSGLDPAAREHFLADLAALTQRPAAPAMVFVTHHVEEIRPWMTHAMLLKQGCVMAAGRLQEVLTDANFSAAFEHPCRIERDSTGGYRLVMPEAD